MNNLMLETIFELTKANTRPILRIKYNKQSKSIENETDILYSVHQDDDTGMFILRRKVKILIPNSQFIKKFLYIDCYEHYEVLINAITIQKLVQLLHSIRNILCAVVIMHTIAYCYVYNISQILLENKFWWRVAVYSVSSACLCILSSCVKCKIINWKLDQFFKKHSVNHD